MTEPITTTQQVTIAAPGSQVIAVLLAGLLMAFSFQLIVAILQVIAGLIALGIQMAMRLESTEALPANLPGDTMSGSEIITAPPADGQPERTTSNGLSPGATPDPSKKASSDVSQTIGLITGVGLIVGINLAIFPASFFAIKLSRVDRPILGMISGLVLWSAYFLILTWLSSQALGGHSPDSFRWSLRRSRADFTSDR